MGFSVLYSILFAFSTHTITSYTDNNRVLVGLCVAFSHKKSWQTLLEQTLQILALPRSNNGSLIHRRDSSYTIKCRKRCYRNCYSYDVNYEDIVINILPMR